MERLTRFLSDGKGYLVDDHSVSRQENGLTGEAVERLAQFENLYEELLVRYESILGELEKLRRSNRSKSYQFREMLGQKMMNESILNLFAQHGIK